MRFRKSWGLISRQELRNSRNQVNYYLISQTEVTYMHRTGRIVKVFAFAVKGFVFLRGTRRLIHIFCAPVWPFSVKPFFEQRTEIEICSISDSLIENLAENYCTVKRSVFCVISLSSGVGEGPKRRKRATQGGPTSEPQLDSQMSEEEEEGFENPGALDSDYRSREELTMIMAQFDPADLIPYGHSFEDLVVSCTYRGISCR